MANYKTSVSKSTSNNIMIPDCLKENDVKIELTNEQARDILDYLSLTMVRSSELIDDPIKTRLLLLSTYLTKKVF